MNEELKVDEQKMMNRPRVCGTTMREIYMEMLHNKSNSVIDEDGCDEEAYEFNDPDCYCE